MWVPVCCSEEEDIGKGLSAVKDGSTEGREDVPSSETEKKIYNL